jgi:hypothetical protein
MREISVPRELAFAILPSIQKKNRDVEPKEHHFIVVKFTTSLFKAIWYVEYTRVIVFPGILFHFPE